jgi:putative transposase
MNDADTFRGKFRIKSTRKPMWDYGWNGAYFVTICTKNRVRCFGDMNIHGTNTDRVPVETEDFPSLPVSDTTPIHGNTPTVPYTFIDHTRMNVTQLGDAARHCWSTIPDHFPFVILDAFVVMPNHIHGIIVIDKNNDDADHYISMDLPGNHAGGQSQNLGSIIRGFKIGVTKFAKENNIDFAWQPGFHDRIIQDDEGLNAVRRYIANNPRKG